MRLNVIIVILIGLAGCVDSTPGKTQRVGMHVDAVLEFAIEYPLDWAKQSQVVRERREGQVNWRTPRSGSTPPALELTVYSLRSMSRDEVEREIMTDLQQSAPNFQLTDRQTFEGENRPGLRIQGYTPGRVYALYLFQSSQRTYILKFSAPPEVFSSQQPVINEVVDSFLPLDRP